jgi:small subunit ribosomal protein S13
MSDNKQEKQADNYKHIVRIANVDIPGDKPIIIGLTKIKGVGKNLAAVFCNVLKVQRTKKTGNLSEDEISKLNEAVQTPLNHEIPVWMVNRRKDYETGEDRHILTGTLNFVKDNDLKRLKKIKTHKGVRHQRGLPVRGQRTRSNFRKSKGKVVGVKKKGTPSKK